jgi:glutaminyl-tRNA synthetase
VTEVHCDYLPETKSGTPGAEGVKVKGTIHWVDAGSACESAVHLYERLFRSPHPGRESGDYLRDLNPNSKATITAYLESSLGDARPGDQFQFERHGYFVADLKASRAGAPVLNRTVTLRDSWGRS